jgi:hypothetical protein
MMREMIHQSPERIAVTLAAVILAGASIVSARNASAAAPKPKDRCSNLIGVQKTIPTGFERGAKLRCVRKLPAAAAPPTAPAPSPSPGTRENPYSLGTSVRFTTNGAPLWTIKVVAVQPDAGAAVLAANRNNKVPTGFQDFMVTLQVTYDGASGRFDESNMRAVGASGIGYTTFGNSCGIIPQPTPGPNFLGTWPEQFAGSSVPGNVCWQIPAGDAASLVMYVGNSSAPAFFALR